MASSNSIRAGLKSRASLGKGTTFRVYIPFVENVEAETDKAAPKITVRGGTETILLVEDERPVRELVARLLQNHGYKVWQAASGDEALGVWQEHKKEISPSAHRPRHARQHERP